MSDKEDVIEGPGFTIIDRRISSKKTEEESATGNEKTATSEKGKASIKKGEKKPEHQGHEKAHGKDSQNFPLPEVDFPSFLMSLSTSGFIHLGEIPDPSTNSREINLALAKQTIDLITMIKEKTEGNRTNDEDRLIDELLYTLRMKFLEVSDQNPS